MSKQPILQIENLRVSFRIHDEYYAAVDGVSLTVNENEVVAIVGESGCGKSALALSIMGLHPLERTKLEGTIAFKGKNLLPLSVPQLNQIRGKDIGMIFQDPLTALNPLMSVGRQIEESMDYHTKLSSSAKRQRTLELLKRVGIPNPEKTYDRYPHELSGGMRQRIVIAIAIACEPSLIIADEPTTALDVTIQAQIMGLLKELQQQMKTGIILITHDLGVVAEMADRVAVMYAGEIVELADVNTLFSRPLHPYTRSLLHSIPSVQTRKEKLHVIQGIVPSLQKLPRTGCRFKSRISWIDESEHEKNPILREVAPGHWVRCTCYKNFYFPQDNIGDMNYGIS
ncbi:ABC transporter ATP-binding protein [Thermaerobacillus caldiproteolyticus]|uniref:Peptide/nickel transport system ATP-binding protein n=1 Tax=Thermaerobacillus caldiproteolyticus TaxID=247480 RepID=A0A7V9Z9F2_9BACL|nr:ABC transporter ATP-binding protein [Anoxybacillus caldiproteolyticus]MBA2876403.1 peptide/nickel transport system ATP-binding protein [Anoxybacillus caldiproteolyticus]